MTILIDNKNNAPIYEQIYGQIRSAILSGELQPHEPLPSIRGLARELRISFITTKRAYEELEKDGFLYTIPAKGCYVAERSGELLREETLRQIEEHMGEIVTLARQSGLTGEEVLSMMKFCLEE